MALCCVAKTGNQYKLIWRMKDYFREREIKVFSSKPNI